MSVTGIDLRSLPRLATALRAGGVKLGTDSLLLATRALGACELTRRSDVHAALRCSLVHDPGDFELFDALFDALFPAELNLPRDTRPLLPRSPLAGPSPAMKRLAQALLAVGTVRRLERRELEQHDASGTASDTELLRRKDFEQMSAAELEAARDLLRQAFPDDATRLTRRYQPERTGRRLDLRAMLRASSTGKEFIPRHRRLIEKPRDWVLIMDVSGSMAAYSRMFLHFAHALRRRSGGLEAFTFATRLTRITRVLSVSDPDLALAGVTSLVGDWEGGTRLGDCLAEFNRHWARRVMSRGAWVLLLSDGLERGPVDVLEAELARLGRLAHQLVWLNPLLRSATYQPLAAGAAVIERHASLRQAAHNVDSLLSLGRLLAGRQNS
ncbi:MAG: vWA domain-containing protein [Steroidobacteraceae bacterium]